MRYPVGYRRLAWRMAGMILVLSALFSGSGCELSGPPQERHTISMRLPDSVQAGDSLVAILRIPGDTVDFDLLWDGPVPDSGLDRLPAPHYRGGEAELEIRAWRGGNLFYSVRITYYGDTSKPKLANILPADTLAPVLHWDGPDSLDLDSLRDEDAWDSLFPGMVCVDNRDRDDSRPIVEYKKDTTRAGMGWLRYSCRDRAGNVSPPVGIHLRILSQVDTVPPVISFDPVFASDGVRPLHGDTIGVWFGDSIRLAKPTCLDERDPYPILSIADTALRDSVERFGLGRHPILYRCRDNSGNEIERALSVDIEVEPDTVKPVIAWTLGDTRDTLVLFDGETFPDTAARCTDDRGGVFTEWKGVPADTRIRGTYPIEFHCADSTGNAAVLTVVVRIQRAPDSAKPVLTLRGPDSVQVWQGSAYVDSGASCVDARDGTLPVRDSGSVNTSVRGLYTLIYTCADSAGNGAAKTRKILVARVPDTTKPALTLRGPDSLQVWQGSAYVDSGATCVDARDGALPVRDSGSVDTSVRGLYILRYACTDSAGNAAAKSRKVLVARTPDSVKPVLKLLGASSVRIQQNAAYVDSGATCVDARDGAIPAKTQGSVNTSVPAIYVLTYTCSDSAGNAATPSMRSVEVAEPDSTPPVLTMIGPDTMLVVSEAGFVDPGGTCLDAENGVLPVTKQGITRTVTGPGWYEAGYACTDSSGNQTEKKRVLKLGLVGPSIPAIADAQIDTLDPRYNMGGIGAVGFVNEPNGNYFNIIRFDLTRVDQASLKSAKLHFFTFLHQIPYAGGFAKYTFKVYRVKSDWVEGTGDWYYHDGGYRNGGTVMYQYYPLSDSMKAIVSNPASPTGITGASKAMVRDSALVLVSTQSDSLYYGPWNGNPNQIPAPDHLTPLELDVTDYVRTADPAKDYGFIIKVYGAPAGMMVDLTTRETGGGPWAPRLMLEY